MIRKIYSQAAQDLWVLRDVFGWMTNGYFMDIGAAGGVELSNTYILEERFAWSGICVEANPETFKTLQANRRCRKINCCLAGKPGKVRFAGRTTYYGGILSNERESDQSEPAIELEARTLKSLILEENVPETIHYLSLDVEGAEEEIMSTFPYNTHKFLAATIERPSDQLRKTLKEAGYLIVAEHPSLDVFYLHPSLADSYRIRAIETAFLKSLDPGQRMVQYIKNILRHGIRTTIRRW